MKKILWIGVLGVLATALLAGCQKTPEMADTKIIRVAFNQSEAHPEYLAMKEFGEKFSQATNGAYEVQIYPNAIMGDQGAVTELVRTGALQMAMVPISVPEGYNRDFAIVSAPYLYDNCDQLKAAAVSGVFDTLFATTKKYNFEVVTLYTSGARHVYADRPIQTPEDLAGCKIRVMDSETYIKMMKLMSGVGIPMSQGEVYTAIQQKVIEGGENSERVYVDFKHNEIAPYFSYTNHLVLADVVVANSEFLDDMDQSTRALFDQLMEESMLREFELWDISIAEAKAEAEENGAIFTYPDIDAFRRLCQPLLQEVAGQSEVTAEIYEKVQEIIAEQEGETS